ncbi:hypothetical protein [Streptomyces sp. Ru62]|uniref:hypothetical protein n=1 Tax=Streptomyces sp. Ru62 TaxID=2080745 RepID=UPI0011B0D203|nr:hypothetical protein [Streptomyces sp. Ru62]
MDVLAAYDLIALATGSAALSAGSRAPPGVPGTFPWGVRPGAGGRARGAFVLGRDGADAHGREHG